MCYSSISSIKRKCVTGGIMAGVAKIYMIAFKDLSIISGGNTYTVGTASTANTIQSIGVTNVPFVEIGSLKLSSSLADKIHINLPNDTSYFEHDLQFNLSDIDESNLSFIINLFRQEVAIIIKSRNQTYFTVGLDGTFYLVDGQISIGKNGGDLYGCNLIFKGTSLYPIRPVNPSIIPELVGEYTPPTPVTFTAYWGWVGTASYFSGATNSSVESLQGHATLNTGSNIAADFRDNTDPQYLVMGQPSTEPVKTSWYGSPFNQGSIGGTDDLFASPLIVGSYSVYISQYKTEQTDTKIDFIR